MEKLWVQNGVTFFFGPIFIHPEETEHEPTKMFYKREVFLSHLEETLPITCVIGTAHLYICLNIRVCALTLKLFLNLIKG